MGYPKDITAIINSISILTIEAARFFKKFAQLSPEEQEKYRGLLESKVLFKIDEIKDSASNATKVSLDKMAGLSQSIDNNEKQMQVLDIDLRGIYNEEYKKVVDSGETDPETIRSKVVQNLVTDKRGYASNSNAQDFFSKKREKKGLALATVDLKTRFNKSQASLIISNGIYQKINRRNYDVQIETPVQGGSRYIESLLNRYRPIIDEFDSIITALMKANVGGKAAPEAIELTKVFGPEAFGTQFLLRPTTPSKQASVLPQNLEKITVEDFRESLVYVVKRDREAKKILEKNPDLGSFNSKGEATLNDAGEEKLSVEMDKFEKTVGDMFNELNGMPNTYQKFSEMSKWLDPLAPSTRDSSQSIRRSLRFLGGKWKRINDMQKLKLPSGKLGNPDELRKLISDGMVETSGVRAYAADRLHIEAQDERNHFSILLAITDMAAESGYPRITQGREFLDKLPSDELRGDPQIIEEAKRLDSIERKNFHLLRDIMIDMASNKRIPAWLLMKIIDTFAVIGTVSSIGEKEKFRAINSSVLAIATKALESQGWKPATDDQGRLKKQVSFSRNNKDRQGEVGIVFEKTSPAPIAPATGTYKARVTRADAGAVTQLQSQLQDIDKQLAGIQATMAPLQQRKEQLSIQLKGEQERTAQEQQAQQMAQAQNAPAAPVATASKSKYKVIYKT